MRSLLAFAPPHACSYCPARPSDGAEARQAVAHLPAPVVAAANEFSLPHEFSLTHKFSPPHATQHARLGRHAARPSNGTTDGPVAPPPALSRHLACLCGPARLHAAPNGAIGSRAARVIAAAHEFSLLRTNSPHATQRARLGRHAARPSNGTTDGPVAPPPCAVTRPRTPSPRPACVRPAPHAYSSMLECVAGTRGH
ncbi:hypothetical protein DENSPDRAFT_882856 [Dentipellis sp. KUC8613]|nr:hypothetical protein DENSPDRAFT_882856 [Dentipellis sp. KUC8613]